MFKFLSFFNTPSEPKKPSPYSSLISKLHEIATDTYLKSMLPASTTKMYIVNTYTKSFTELSGSLHLKALNRTTTTINLGAYFDSSTPDSVIIELKKIANYLETNEISKLIEADLETICDAYFEIKGWY